MPNLFFEHLSSREKEEFLSGCETEIYRKDAPIILKDDTGRDLFVLKSGSATAADNWDEDVVPLAIFAEGDVFGEMSFVDGSPRSATVVANEDSIVYRMSFDRFQALMDENPRLASRFLLGFMRVLVRRLQFTDQTFTTLAVMNRELKKNAVELRKAMLIQDPDNR
jgi:CRP/FNR family cyclic AMP-dependent transcriptional regulator